MKKSLTLTTIASMTSLEIATLVEKRHDNVKRTIETLAERGVIRLPQIEISEKINNLGLPQKSSNYVFAGDQGKRDSIIVVAQLSPEFTARLVDRWQELEAKQAPSLPDFSNPAAAARAWADEYEAKQIALAALEAAQPAIEFHERVGNDENLHSIDELAKALRAPVRKTHALLKGTFQLFRKDGLPKQELIARDYMRVIEVALDNGRVYPQAFFTGKGMLWIQRKIDHNMIGSLI